MLWRVVTFNGEGDSFGWGLRDAETDDFSVFEGREKSEFTEMENKFKFINCWKFENKFILDWKEMDGGAGRERERRKD